MEYLDIYDENHNYLGRELRNVVHKKGLWHNTVHCWLYDKEGYIYFQIRKDEEKLYTTASGHVSAGESIKEAFGREIYEEIGLKIDYEQAELVEIVVWQMDKKQSNGSVFKDRAFANVNICEFNGDMKDFKFDENEVLGIAKVKASEALTLFKSGKGIIKATVIKKDFNNNQPRETIIDFNNFLVNKHETAIGKYGKILEKVISKI